MAKHKQESFADFVAKLKENNVSAKQVAVIEERKYFLIVSEGIRTEPLYFNHLKNFLPNHLLETIEINGAGDNTINIVHAAIQGRNKRLSNELLPPFDEVWAVYDKDDFPAHRFNEAVALAAQEGIGSAHSNQSFELWYILHFEYLDTAIHRTAYIKRLSELFNFKYEKGTSAAVNHLFEHGNVKLAISRAKKLSELNAGKTPSDSCPLTMVHELVEKLLMYARHPSIDKPDKKSYADKFYYQEEDDQIAM
jgi:hypothetical protein